MFKSVHDFQDEHGRIKAWPSKRRQQHQMAILDHLIGHFEAGVLYSREEALGLIADLAEVELVELLLNELTAGDYLAEDERGLWRADARPTGAVR